MPEDSLITTLDSPWIKAATDGSFAKMVLQNSHQGPVLANFWSKKAGPCIRQYPVLDKVIHQLEGKALLVNIDVQSEREIIAELGIASVPTLKVFLHGQVIETLHGYQNERALHALLAPHIVRESDRALARAVKLYEGGQAQRAYELLTEAILIDPDNQRLPASYAKLLIFDERFTDAQKLLAAIPENQRSKELERLSANCFFLVLAADIAEPEGLVAVVEAAQPEHHNFLPLQRDLCALAVVNKDYQTAFTAIDAIIRLDRQYDEQFARRATLELTVLIKAQDEEHKEAGLKRARQALAAYVH